MREFAPRLGYIPRRGPKQPVAETDLIDMSAVNLRAAGVNHGEYVDSPELMADLRRLLQYGERPPHVCTPKLKRLPIAGGGVYWRHEVR